MGACLCTASASPHEVEGAASATPREVKVLDWLGRRATNKDGLLQTYDALPGHAGLEQRHDVYDNALAAILFDMHGEEAKARSILSGFVKLMGDVAPDGRLAASYGQDGAVQDGRVDAGNNSWAIVALAYHGKLHPGSGFLESAIDLKNRLKKEHNFAKSIPFDPKHPHSIEQTANSGNCSTENTTDAVTAARICGDHEMLQVCSEFVQTMFDPHYDGTPEGAYLVGTNPTGDLDYDPLPCDCQTWTFLADADPDTARHRAAMGAILKVFYRTDAPPGYAGVLFSNYNGATSIQMENTASCAMAMAKYNHETGATDGALVAALKAIDDTLTGQVSKHNGGVVAAIQKTASGYGYDYLPTPHLASTVWTGMYFGVARAGGYDAKFNPYQVGK